MSNTEYVLHDHINEDLIQCFSISQEKIDYEGQKTKDAGNEKCFKQYCVTEIELEDQSSWNQYTKLQQAQEVNQMDIIESRLKIMESLVGEERSIVRFGEEGI